MGKQAFSVNITADEVIAPGSTIELAFAAPVEEKSAQGAIRVTCGCEPRSVRIEVAKRGRLVRVNVDETVLGACRLVIAELLGAKGERLVDAYRLPFSVAPLPGKLPAGLRVEHAVRLLIGDLHVERVAPRQDARAATSIVVKAVHRTKGTAGRARVRRARQTGRRRRPARASWPHAAPPSTAAFTRRCTSGSSRPEAASASRSSCGRASSCPPLPTTSQPIAGRWSAPAAEQKVLEALRGQASRLRAALKRSEVELVQRPAHRQRRALCHARDRDRRADPEPRREQERRRDPVRRHERAERPRQLDRGCALRSGAPGRLRRHRHSRRGLGGRSRASPRTSRSRAASRRRPRRAITRA